jgi:FkbM family methyltransferase
MLLNTHRLRFGVSELDVTIRDGIHLRVDPNDLIGRTVFVNGLWEAPIATHFANHIQPGDYVLDIGANLGQFSLLAAVRAGATGKVFAVEASPVMASRLRQNISLNGFRNVEVIEAAAWNTAGTLLLTSGQPGNRGMAKVVGEGVTEQVTPVRAVRLEDVLAGLGCPRVDVVKIDIEGAELKALQGLSHIIEHSWPRQIYCEVVVETQDDVSPTNSLLDLLEKAWGYQGDLIDGVTSSALTRDMVRPGLMETALFSRPDGSRK